jgi:trimeric autotransporter adhesin
MPKDNPSVGRRFFRMLQKTLSHIQIAISTRVGSALIVFLLLSSILTGAIAGFGGMRADAQANTTVNFQARILQSSGALVPDGNYHLEFKIYNTVSTGATAQGVCSGNCLWLETRTTGNLVRVVNGYVSVYLGDVTAFPSTMPWGDNLYVTMRVGGAGGSPSWDTEMVNGTTGRMKLSAVPYAFTASNLATSATNSASTNSSNISIQSGNATGATSNSGNVSVDTGTATGTAGTISLGSTNASAITLGRTGITTTNSGAMTVSQLLTAGGNLTIAGGTDFGVYYRDASDNVVTTAAGTSGQCFRATTGAAPSWGTCAGTGDIVQDGNSFGAAMTIGTNDTFDFNLETDGTTRLTIDDTTGNITLTSDLAVNGGDITTASGDLTIAPNSGVTNVTGELFTNTLTVGTAPSLGSGIAVWVEQAFTPGAADTDTNIVSLADSTPTASDNTTQVTSIQGSASTSGTFDTGVVTGIVGTASKYGSSTAQTVQGGLFAGDSSAGTVVNLYGSNNSAGIFNSGTGTVTNAAAGNFNVYNDGTGTITNGFGLRVQSATNTGGGTLTNNYGLFVDNQTAGVSDYGIYVAGADTYALFVDAGATRLDGTLEVQGLATLTGGITVETGDTFTFNGDAFTDLTGSGLAISSGALTLDTTSATGAFINGGNTFPGASVIGNNNNANLGIETNGTTRLTVEADGDVAFDTNTLFVDALNNGIGIGTTTVDDALDIVTNQNADTDIQVSNTNAGNAAQSRIVLSSNAGDFFIGNTSTTYTGFTGATYLATQGNREFRIMTNAINRLSVEGDGDIAVDTNTLFVNATNDFVSVGSTSDLGARLQVVGANNETQLLVRANATQSMANPLVLLQNSSGSELARINATTSSLFFGNAAGGSSAAGVNNTGIGASALGSVSTGTGNTTLGSGALASVSVNDNNTAVGYNAGNLATGGNNIFLGALAGDNVTTGTDNIIIGYNLDASAAGVSNELRIGGVLQGNTSTLAAQFNGTLAIATLGTTDTATFLCRNTSNIISGCNFSPLSSTLTDNITDALDIQEGTNNYININTTNTSENISFGNATTNPSFTFLGSGRLTVSSGSITSPGGSQSEQFGLNATAAGSNSVALGNGANASGNDSVAIGEGSDATNSNSLAIGRIAQATGQQSIALLNAVASAQDTIAIGYNSDATTQYSVALGSGAQATGGNFGSIALGYSSIASANDTVALGSSATANGTRSIAIGASATNATFANSVALGAFATNTAANQIVIGAGGNGINNLFLGAGVTNFNAANEDVSISATGGDGTDVGGADLAFNAGRSTGSASGGSLLFRTSSAGSTGTSLNSLTTRLTIDTNGLATFANNVSITGTLGVSTLGTADTSTFLCRNSSNLIAGCVSSPLTNALADNITDAFDLQEGTNNYININTTNASENISFGNATTNPSYNFLGTGNLTVDTNVLYVDSTNNRVGINTTPSVANSVLEVGANSGGDSGIEFKPTAGNETLITFNSGVGDNIVIVADDTAESLRSTANGTDFTLNFAGATLNRNLAVDTNTLYVDATGDRVGIGNTGSTGKLSVSGATSALGLFESTGANNAFVRIASPASQQAGLEFATNGSTRFQLGAQTDNTFFLYDNANSRDAFNITNTGNVLLNRNGGNVGIGNATAPNRLSVNTLTVADANAQVAISTGATTAKGLVVQRVAGQSANILEVQNESGTPIAYVSASGNVVTEGEFISQYSVRSSDAATASNAFTVRSGNTTGGTGLSTGSLTLKSGDGSGTNTSSGNIVIDSGSVTGTGTAGSISLGATNASAVTLGRTGITTTNAGALTVTGLTTLNGGLTIEPTDTFTFNGDGFTDFTGGGLVNTGGVLTVDTTGATGFFQQGGNSFGASATLGTNDAQSLILETNNQTAVTIASGGATTFQNATNSTSAFRVLNTAGTSTAFNVDTSNTRVGIGTASPGAILQISGNQSSSAWGTSGMAFRVSTGTYTDTTSSGTVANVVGSSFNQPTFAASSVTTYTDSATLYLAGAPLAGTNVTLTNRYALQIASGATLLGGNLTVTGLTTLNGGLTVETGDTFTFNGDAFTDLTGSGLTISANALTVDATTATGFFRNGGNDFGGNATLGTNTAGQTLALETANTTRFTVSATAATLTGTGATTLTSSSTLDLSSATASNLSVTTGTTGVLTLDTGTTGAINIGTNANAKTVTIGNTTGASALNLQSGTGGLNITTQGTGGLNIGANAVAQALTIGNGTGATGVTINTGTNGVSIGTNGVANTIQIGNTSGAVTQSIAIGTNNTASSTSNVSIGSTIGGTTLIQNATTISLNAGTVVGNATTQNLFNTIATTVNAFGASTNTTLGATTGSLTVRNSNVTFGNAAGSGLFQNNGATRNATLALGDLAAGSIGTAATTVDIYTSISIAPTASGRTYTLPTPTSATIGRVLYISNISGTQTFIIGGTTFGTNSTATMFWNGTVWAFAGMDGGSNNYIQNQNSVDQVANFRIGGSGIISPTAASAVALTVNGTTGTAATALSVVQAGAASAFTATANGITTQTAASITSTGILTTTGNLLTVTANSATTATGVVSINATGLTTGAALNVTSNASATAIQSNGNITFGELTGTRTLGVQTRTTGVAGTALTVQAGAGGAGAGFAGGALTLQGGSAGGTNANGGNVTLVGGVGAGSGVKGLVVADTFALSTATVQTFGTLNGTTAITQSNVDGFGAVLLSATNTGITFTLGDPTLGALATGRLIYITNSGTNDFILSANAGIETITLKPSTTATMIWNGSDWTAAGASSATDLQAAYDNTATNAGGAELVLNASGGAADGLTIRNNGTTPIIGGLLEVQSSIGSNLFTVNNNATEFANNGGSESATYTMWTGAFAGGTVTRNTTASNVATGQGSVSVVTGAVIGHGAENTLTSALTPNLKYAVAYTVKGNTNFSTLETVYSRDGTNTSTVSCNSAQTVTTAQFTRINCTFTAPASGIIAANSIFIRQTDATGRTFFIDNLSVTVSADVNHATDGSVDLALGTNWTDFGANTAGTTAAVRNTTVLYDTSGSVEKTTGATADRGIVNNMSINPAVNTQYLVTFYARSSNTFNDIRVRYSRDGGTNFVSCIDYNTQVVSTTAYTRITCVITTDGTVPSNPDIIIDQPTATARTFYVDALTVTLNTNNSNNVQIGGGSRGGPTTLFTLDRSAGNPIAANNDAYLGSMYYDTTTGRIQCYEADGWGACGAAPDNIVNLNPEYAGAVLNGSGVGTMTADFCATELVPTTVLSVNTALCAEGEARNYYKWTSPQLTQQTYSIFVTYQLPATFNGFSSDDTIQLAGRTDSTTNAAVTYEVFRSTGSAVTACGTETTVVTTANTWQSVGINGNEATGCGFNSSAAGNFVIFKINLKANTNASAYASTLSFVTTGR